MPAPHPDLDAALERVRAAAGARQVRVVDGRGVVLASVGEPPAPGADDPAAVARLVRDLRTLDSTPGDVVVSTPGAVHVLRPCAEPGTFVQVRLARPGADPSRTGGALDAAGLRPLPTREPDLVPAPRGDSDAQQPALAALGARRAVGLGRASAVLGEHVGAVPAQRALPRRATSAAPPASPAPSRQQVWATDLDTLRRVLTGLRTLA